MEYINDVTTAFCALAATPGSAIEDWMDILERLVVLLYDRTSSQESVNQGSKQLFTEKRRAIDGLQHTKRAAYQAGHC